jgi:hypothetical protein
VSTVKTSGVSSNQKSLPALIDVHQQFVVYAELAGDTADTPVQGPAFAD